VKGETPGPEAAPFPNRATRRAGAAVVEADKLVSDYWLWQQQLFEMRNVKELPFCKSM
jgi:hypothetical protein